MTLEVECASQMVGCPFCGKDHAVSVVFRGMSVVSCEKASSTPLVVSSAFSLEKMIRDWVAGVHTNQAASPVMMVSKLLVALDEARAEVERLKDKHVEVLAAVCDDRDAACAAMKECLELYQLGSTTAVISSHDAAKVDAIFARARAILERDE
jgi:hypothetical protein